MVSFSSKDEAVAMSTRRTGETVLKYRIAAVFFVFGVALSSLFGVQAVHAAGETYTLTLSSSRIQEYDTPGVTLYLRVTGASPSSTYKFSFTVTDASGIPASANSSMVSGNATFTSSIVYPRDFGTGARVQFVGNYTVDVSQTLPVVKTNVQTGEFLVGVTESITYQRTDQVSTVAEGYFASENVGVSVLHESMLVAGFPLYHPAAVDGSFSFTWKIPSNESIGNYSIRLTGSTTNKSPADAQAFTVYPANVIIPGLTVNSVSISRTVEQEFLFSPQYPSGQRVQSGQVALRIQESDSVTQISTSSSYDNKTGVFRAAYTLDLDALTGSWVAWIEPNTFDDGFGNKGPAQTVVVGFNVQAAALDVSIASKPLTAITFRDGGTIPIQAVVKYPDGTRLTSGSATARLSQAVSGVSIGIPIRLSFIPDQQDWEGSYIVGVTDPSGIWLVTVEASDQFGNSGSEALPTSVSTSTSQPSQFLGFTTSLFLLVATIVAAAALGVVLVLLIRRKNLTREVKLDLTVVDREADRIQESSFFKRVKEQINDKKESNNSSPSAEDVNEKSSLE